MKMNELNGIEIIQKFRHNSITTLGCSFNYISTLRDVDIEVYQYIFILNVDIT